MGNFNKQNLANSAWAFAKVGPPTKKEKKKSKTKNIAKVGQLDTSLFAIFKVVLNYELRMPTRTIGRRYTRGICKRLARPTRE